MKILSKIETFGYIEPPEVISSAQIEAELGTLYQRLGLPEGRLELMTGIRERRFWSRPVLPSEASAMAGDVALEKSTLSRDQIDLVLHCGVCRDRLEPATAAYVHSRLGLSAHTQFMDISNACLGFLNGMILASGMIESGMIRSALVCSGENGRPLLERTIDILKSRELSRKEIKPYFANLTIGAGAVACVIADSRLVPDARWKLTGHVGRVDSAANVLCQGDQAGVDGLEMLTEAEALLEAGIRLATTTWQDFLTAKNWKTDTPDRFITHQVGRMHQKKLVETLGLDPARDFVTYPWLGNVGSVSLPITLAQALEQYEIKAGNQVALLGIGSGLSCLMTGFEVEV